MSKSKIAIQGELGAYSHIAVKKLYGDPEIKTCATFEETFKHAYNDPSYKIVIPIENSLAGRVADIHYLLIHSSADFPSGLVSFAHKFHAIQAQVKAAIASPPWNLAM